MSTDNHRISPRRVARKRRDSAHEAALHLMPEVAERRVPGRRLRHRLLSTGLATLSALTLATAIALPVWLARDAGLVSQVNTAVTAIPATDLAEYAAVGDAAAETSFVSAPIVLSYHDIRPDAGDEKYVISPADFEGQMQMLTRAGWTSLTLEDFQAYQKGDFTPPARSFLLTFDDGTKGLWRYADPILERYGISATSFLITGSVGTSGPYYLNWAEIQQMHASGRWSFGSHTHDLHHRVPIDAQGTQAGALSHLIRSTSGATETTAAFTTRVESDLDRSIAIMEEHGLPTPVALSYPFRTATSVPPASSSWPRS